MRSKSIGFLKKWLIILVIFLHVNNIHREERVKRFIKITRFVSFNKRDFILKKQIPRKIV